MVTQQYITFLAKHWGLTLLFTFAVFLIIIYEAFTKALGIKRFEPQEVVQLINWHEGIIIDIRNSNKFNQGHIIRAINITPTQLTQELKNLLPYQDKPIIVVSDLDQTAMITAKKMLQQGFKSVQVLAGGIKAWQAAGFPLERNK